MFVSTTWMSTLCKALQKQDDLFSKLHKLPRIKFVETGGSKMIQVLGIKNPWENTPCGRPECWPCLDDKTAGRCRYEGIVYTITCNKCKGDGAHLEYTGESSRSSYSRSQEHKAAQIHYHYVFYLFKLLLLKLSALGHQWGTKHQRILQNLRKINKNAKEGVNHPYHPLW